MMRLATAAALSTVLAVLAGPAAAYTATEAKNCMKDAFKLCSAQIPNVDKVARCMRAKRGQLTPACAEAVDRFFATGTPRHGKAAVYRN
jgi:hypothetical protein